MSFRALKRKARRDLHEQLQVPALYITPGGGAAVPCTIRVHTKFDALGDIKGTSFSYAEREEKVPQIISVNDQVLPLRAGVFSVEPGEAYRVDTVYPKDDITTTSRVVILRAEETVGLTVPDVFDNNGINLFDPLVFGKSSTATNYFESDIPQITGSPEYVTAGEPFILPLDNEAIGVDKRNDVLASHDFYVDGKFRPYAVGDQYFIRVTLELTSVSTINSVVFSIDIGGEAGETLSMSQTFPRNNAGRTVKVTFFARIYCLDTFYANGGEFVFNFENDVTIEGVRLYVSA